MDTALVLIDIQNDYFPNGSMELSKPIEASNNAAKVLQKFREANGPIFHVQHINKDEAAGFFLPGTEGAEIHESVKPAEGEDVTVKYTPNSFFMTDLENKLKEKEVTKLVVCGMMSHMCVDATVRAAMELGFETTLIEDACTCPDLNFNGKTVPAEQVHYAFMGALGSLGGIYATVVSAEEYLKNEKAVL